MEDLLSTKGADRPKAHRNTGSLLSIKVSRHSLVRSLKRNAEHQLSTRRCGMSIKLLIVSQ